MALKAASRPPQSLKKPTDELARPHTPIAEDELKQAADLLSNFQSHWERLEGDEEARHELVKLIVERVYVQDDRVVAMTLRSNYHLVLNHKTNGPTEFTVDPSCVTYGSDGGGPLTCKILIFLPKHIAGQFFSSKKSFSFILSSAKAATQKAVTF